MSLECSQDARVEPTKFGKEDFYAKLRDNLHREKFTSLKPSKD
jgi:hypothetical protein